MAGVQGYKTLAVLVGLIMSLVLMAFAGPAAADERVALVIGNAAYTQDVARLKNPGNDATAVAAALRRLGFKVIEGRDLDRNGFFDQIAAFDDAARSADLALFFYAGHGLQVNGRNYLAPVDMRLERRQDLRQRAIELAAVLEVMRSETNLVILDACRNNPLAGDLARTLGLSRAAVASRGLAKVESAMGTLIAYATEPGDVAADGTGDHSPYTTALLAHIETPGLSVNDLFTEVTASVLASTGGKQKPWTHTSMSKIVRLMPGGGMPPPPPLPADKEAVFWETVKDSKDPAELQAYLEQYPEGTYKALALNRLRKLWELRLAAVDAGNLRDYLGRGLSPSAVDEEGWTDLHYAAASNLPEVVKALLDAGADVAAGASWPEEGEGPRYEAIGHFLEALGFKLDFWGTGLTPLHVAAWGNARGAALKLIAGGADVNAASKEGEPPLQWAAWANARETLVELIKGGADIHAKDNNGSTPLHYAARNNAGETLVELMERGADIHAKDNNGSTPLHYAARNNAGETLVELMERGADIHAKDNNGSTPLHYAAWGNAREAALALIEHGAEIWATHKYGRTPFFLAAIRNARETLLELVGVGVGNLAETKNGEKLLHFAANADAQEIVTELIARGVDFEAKDDQGHTPLHWAARGDAREVALGLIRRGADIGAKGKNGNTPLHAAAWGNSREVLLELIARGADIEAKTSGGETPLHFAARFNAREVALALIERGADIGGEGQRR